VFSDFRRPSLTRPRLFIGSATFLVQVTQLVIGVVFWVLLEKDHPRVQRRSAETGGRLRQRQSHPQARPHRLAVARSRRNRCPSQASWARRDARQTSAAGGSALPSGSDRCHHRRHKPSLAASAALRAARLVPPTATINNGLAVINVNSLLASCRRDPRIRRRTDQARTRTTVPVTQVGSASLRNSAASWMRKVVEANRLKRRPGTRIEPAAGRTSTASSTSAPANQTIPITFLPD
jgi:hypothetical protein